MQLVICVLCFLGIFAVERSEKETIKEIGATIPAIMEDISSPQYESPKSIHSLAELTLSKEISELIENRKYDDS
jgi:hypothetical protein